MKSNNWAGALLWTGILAVGCAPADESGRAAVEEAPAAQPSAPPSIPGGRFVDPNTATVESLLLVPGLGQPLAEAIVAGRPYADMLAVDQVIGARLTEEQKDEAYSRLWMPLDLNGASEAEILLIPGVGSRMAHEFEEYRPYDGIARFRREIGKYVDSTEVARLERYVTIR